MMMYACKFRGLAMAAAMALTIGLSAPSVFGGVNIEWRAEYSSAVVGDTLEIDLYAVADSPEPQSMAGLSVIMEWDPTVLELTGYVDTSPYAWLAVGFPDDSGLDGVNNDLTDGQAYLQALRGLPPEPAPVATEEGLLVATLVFDAVGADYCEAIETPLTVGLHTETVVIDGVLPGVDILGNAYDAYVTVGTCLAAGDFNGDCAIDLSDHSQLIWWITGPVLLPEAEGCGYGDFNNDGLVDLRDIATYQNAFGQ